MTKSLRTLLSIILPAVAVVIAVIVTIVLLGREDTPRAPVNVVLDQSILGDSASEAVSEMVVEFETLNEYIRVVPPDDVHTTQVSFARTTPSEPEVAFRPWWSLGWRLYAFLPTIANYEGEWQQQIILPLTNGEVTLEDFIEMLKASKAEGIVPIATVLSETEKAAAAWKLYTDRLAADFSEYVTEYSSLSDALQGLAEREIMFLFWDDRLPSLVPTPLRPQYRGFAIPGSRNGIGSFFVGEVTWITLSAEAAEHAEAIAFIKYLTSPGTARLLQRKIAGEFFFWDSELRDEAFPEVSGPGEVISP